MLSRLPVFCCIGLMLLTVPISAGEWMSSASIFSDSSATQEPELSYMPLEKPQTDTPQTVSPPIRTGTFSPSQPQPKSTVSFQDMASQSN